MAGNTLQVGSDNALRVKSDGIVVAGASDPCCCVATGDPCSNCSGSTPLTLEVTVSGVTNCGSCVNVSLLNSYGNLPDVNGTWTAVQDPTSACNYYVIIGTVDLHNGTGCGSFNSTRDVYLRVALGSTQVTVTIGSGIVGAIPGASFFNGNVSTSSPRDCMTSTHTVTNAESCVGGVASGGTADVSP